MSLSTHSSSPKLSELHSVIEKLRDLAREVAPRSWAPYSKRSEAVVVLLSDGRYIPGVRVENASFPLTIPAILNGVSTAAALERNDIAAIVSSTPLHPAEIVYGNELPDSDLTFETEYALIEDGADLLPEPLSVLDPVLHWSANDMTEGIQAAREVAERALPRESNFPVGCVAGIQPGSGIPGVNVEHSDWTHILCAERNALGTVRSYGLAKANLLFLSCPKDSNATPCGACRQVIVELAPGAQVWMDRGKRPPESRSADDLLPGYFSGSALLTDPGVSSGARPRKGNPS